LDLFKQFLVEAAAQVLLLKQTEAQVVAVRVELQVKVMLDHQDRVITVQHQMV
jgi:hypothetical protein